MRKNVGQCIALLLVVFSVCSCKKDLKTASIAVDNSNNHAIIPTHPLTWENTDYMPTPAGNPVLVPWASGSNQSFEPAIAFDYNQTDGWVLVY
ncbi:MAG: hypothetical protein WCF67_20110, partial [Chitinophagaceae bacterium]